MPIVYKFDGLIYRHYAVDLLQLSITTMNLCSNVFLKILDLIVFPLAKCTSVAKHFIIAAWKKFSNVIDNIAMHTRHLCQQNLKARLTKSPLPINALVEIYLPISCFHLSCSFIHIMYLYFKLALWLSLPI